MRKKTTHVRINEKTLKNIREALENCDNDTERLDTIWKTSPIRFDDWLGKPIYKKKRK